jgi:eukaryotic-like serine/threonine-protein kinase
VGSNPVLTPISIRFGDDFELDVRAYELRSAGIPVKLKPIPFELLLFLMEHRGELVTREQIVEPIWGKGVFLDTDNSINGAISKIRQVLRDNAAQPRFVQTVTGRGYRFIAPVTEAGTSPPPEPDTAPQTPPAESLIGKKLSHYRILELLGGGGMGVVYKAEDLKLGRRVAIKFLPSELANDPTAFHRLEQEARAASALDHRNICSIYELEEHEGQPFIVMQLLEGQTLQEKLEAAAQEERTLPLSEVLDVAVQVAEGLEAAHQKGIIHRDIKPANIFITSRHEAKILDFGLAKGLEDEFSAEGHLERDASKDLAEVATRPSAFNLRLTLTGIHMGTAFYMSPEQVRGEKLDARTDIFSFGLVLYQMVSGQRAFPGNTTQVVHDGILHNSPVPLRELNLTLPAKLVAIIDKCLEKERERRYQTAAEVRAALEEARMVAASVSAASRRLRSIVIAGVAILIAACVAGIWWWRRPIAESAFKSYRVSALSSSGTVAFATVSPDGRNLIFADEQGPKQSLWLQQVSTSSAVRILGPVPHPLLEGLRFTPDGNYFYYIEEDPGGETQSLYRLGVTGGSPQRIVSDIDDLSSVDISPEGKQLVYTRRNIPKSEYYLLTANADGTGERRGLPKGGLLGIVVTFVLRNAFSAQPRFYPQNTMRSAGVSLRCRERPSALLL